MRVAVTGAGGFLGRHVVEAAARAGHHVIAMSRAGDSVPGASETIATGDLADIIPHHFGGAQALVHCAARVHILRRENAEKAEAAFDARNAQLPIELATAAREAGVSQFVQISSVAAIRSVTPPGQTLGDESVPAPGTPYGRAKLAADEALMQLVRDGFAVTALRPPALYGPGVGGWFAMLARAAELGLPLPVGAVSNRRSFAYVGNVAEAVAATLGKSQSGSFTVADSLPISTADLYRTLLAEAGHPDRVWAWPRFVVDPLARLILRGRASSLLGDAAFDGGRFASVFNWRPSLSMKEALALTMEARRE